MFQILKNTLTRSL